MDTQDLMALSFRQSEDIVDDLRKVAEKDVTGLLSAALAHQRAQPLADELEALIPGLEMEAERARRILADVDVRLAAKKAQLAENGRQVQQKGISRETETALMHDRRLLGIELNQIEGERFEVHDKPAQLAGRVRAIQTITAALRAMPTQDKTLLGEVRKLLK